MLHVEDIFPTKLIFISTRFLDIRQLYCNVKFHAREQSSLMNIHEHNTRNRDQYSTPFISKYIVQRSYLYLSPTFFNTLPETVKLTNIFSFKDNSK